MTPTGARSSLPLLLALLGALLPGPGDAQTSVFPEDIILPLGGSVQVNCSASCDVNATLGLETHLPKEEVGEGRNWKLFQLTDVRESTSPLCFSNCGEMQASASATITVYSFPEVELTQLPAWQPVGANLTLHCLVKGGEPRAHLTAVLLHGEEVLSRQPVVGKHAEVTATVLAGRGDHGANFSCRTELDLRSKGLALFQNTSATRQLRTFDLPMTRPRLTSPRVLELGTEQLVVCSLYGLFPASEAEVHLELGHRSLNSTTTSRKDSVSATVFINGTAEQEGAQPLVCVVRLANKTRETQRNVTFYSFPGPTLTLSKSEVSEGDLVTVVCEAHAGAVVTLSDTPGGPPSSQTQLQLNASAEDHGRRFSCSAALEVAGQMVFKDQTLELSVLYGPRLDERDCLGNWTWQEGSQQTLRCQAWGNPRPQLTCTRKTDGAPLPIGDVRPVKREIEGTYFCRAVSARGNVTREVFLTVVYHQNKLVIIVLVVAGAILSTIALGAHLYNRQRKIKKYRLQKAQEEAAMNLKAQATPP